MATRVDRTKLLEKMRALPGEVRTQIKKALQEGANEIQAMQRRLVPKRTGKLHNSIVQTWGGGGVKGASLGNSGGAGGDPDLTVRISAGNRSVRYAHLVEFGTKPHILGGMFKGAKHPGTAAQPFFFPPWRALRKRVKSRITRATNKAARKVAGK